MKEVGELGRRLLYNAGAKTLPTSGRPWEDNPAAFLAGLEKSAEGCRWLLDHWIGLRVLLDRDSDWTYGDMFRLVRLLGKYPIEAINDPKLNAIFLAWDAVVPGSGRAVLEGVQAVQAAARPRIQRLRPLARDRRPAGRRGAGGSVLSARSSTSKWPGWRSCWKCTRKSPATRRPSWPTGRRLTAAPRASGCGGRRRREAASCGRRSSS